MRDSAPSEELASIARAQPGGGLALPLVATSPDDDCSRVPDVTDERALAGPAGDGARGQSPAIPPTALRPIALLLMGWAAFTSQADPDLFGHVRFGLDILRDRDLPSVDPYSFTQDVPWINHEWLSELIMGSTYALYGAPGLMLLKSIVVLGVFGLLWSGVRHASERWQWSTMAAAALAVSPITVTL